MERLLYFNGALVPEEEVRISPFDHGFLYGDGIFEGIRAYQGRVFRLEDHLGRLYQSAKSLWLTIPETRQQMAEAVLATVRANHLKDAYIRLVVSRGPGDLGLDPRQCPKPTVIIIADQIQLFPESLYESGLPVATASSRRPSGDVLNPQVKSLNYLNSVLAKVEAAQRGVPEMVLLNQLGHVVEGTGDNIFIVRNEMLVTPPRSAGILPGITRSVVMELARGEGIPVVEENFTVHELYNADECFLTGTAAEIIAAVSCDGRLIGDGRPGPLTRHLRARFMEYAANEGVSAYPGLSVI
ncbi:branched-chain-amino-acid transaminase [Sulfobacillus harzensis]|uniref:Branched-chain-amino-acid aminotransferase n=1 Tax=Sulfobacillus harzensis TaxID=2729629 RepID=A0A7Y0L4F6_9FIRM|nr:branched-chain-amino-acid transaminase [Sulfobacillus harzensis]NMP21699.1 branched-chain-amino-acid transaminase [Sulfobacillus harzensis]